VDTLVNNAGVYSYVPLTDLTEKQWDLMIDVNMKGWAGGPKGAPMTGASWI
jgi:NADP-dependent 3-hydroxy acid dehydrogenase YdfG